MQLMAPTSGQKPCKHDPEVFDSYLSHLAGICVSLGFMQAVNPQ